MFYGGLSKLHSKCPEEHFDGIFCQKICRFRIFSEKFSAGLSKRFICFQWNILGCKSEREMVYSELAIMLYILQGTYATMVDYICMYLFIIHFYYE